MFGIEPSEFLLVAIVALVVIGPKDLPRAMRIVGHWVGRARGMARHFRSGFDEMVRQSEMEEMEKRWAAENARIMAEHPSAPPEEAHDAAFAATDPAISHPAISHPPISQPPISQPPGPHPSAEEPEETPAGAPEPAQAAALAAADQPSLPFGSASAAGESAAAPGHRPPPAEESGKEASGREDFGKGDRA